MWFTLGGCADREAPRRQGSPKSSPPVAFEPQVPQDGLRSIALDDVVIHSCAGGLLQAADRPAADRSGGRGPGGGPAQARAQVGATEPEDPGQLHELRYFRRVERARSRRLAPRQVLRFSWRRAADQGAQARGHRPLLSSTLGRPDHRGGPGSCWRWPNALLWTVGSTGLSATPTAWPLPIRRGSRPPSSSEMSKRSGPGSSPSIPTKSKVPSFSWRRPTTRRTRRRTARTYGRPIAWRFRPSATFCSTVTTWARRSFARRPLMAWDI